MINQNSPGLYFIFLRRLNETGYAQRIIPFPVVFEKLCRNFSIKKSECFGILRVLRDVGIIEIIFGHGVLIKNFDKIRISEDIISSELNTRLIKS